MLWSALQATQLIHIDREVATGLKPVPPQASEEQDQEQVTSTEEQE